METARPSDIVFSLAGHDRDSAYLVLETEGHYVFLVDGKTRKLKNPKRKSLKHIRLGKTGSQELAEAFSQGRATDTAIRKELAIFRSEAGMTEEGKTVCQKMML